MNLITAFLLVFIFRITPLSAGKRPKTCKLKRQQIVAAIDDNNHPFTYGTSPAASTSSILPTSTTSDEQSEPTVAAVAVIRSRFPYGQELIRGVNLGGWFVLEPWITPSLFINTNNEAIVDEYTFALYQDQGVARGILENHWNTWIVEEDFKAIAAAGLNHVRIPVPYWAIPTTNTTIYPFIDGAWPHLLRAVDWAATYGISVIIDIHCAPGSQNGYDNSGQKLNYPTWHTSAANVQRTVEAFQTLVHEFSQPQWGGTVGIIEALNEPAGFYDDVLAVTNDYWQQAYGSLRNMRLTRGTEVNGEAADGEIKMAIMDGFRGVMHYNGFLTPPNAEGVLMDTHSYQIFNNDQMFMTDDDHIKLSCERGGTISGYATTNLWTFVGEWTSSPTDCTRWINGRGVGSDWEQAAPGRDCSKKSGRWQNFDEEYKTFLGRYFEAQVAAFEKSQGWVYW
ncbi:exo-1,3-beta-glucanase [Tulasnella sp. 419]|nr:exo-1,3-beta-glucanase [Tulasnella sp. 419]